MDRFEFEDLISAYIERDLSLKERKDIEAYLDKNPSQNQLVKQITSNMESLKKYYSDIFSYEASKNQLISSDYAFWVKKWKNNVSEKKLHFILFEDIQSNPKKTTKRLANSIGLEESFYNDYIFNKKNRS